MSYLLDTHALLWWLSDDEALPPKVRKAIRAKSAEVFVSAASAWEIATKHRLGKLPGVETLVTDFQTVLTAERFDALAISMAHAERAGSLPGSHKDPFDRMLIAQAQAENFVLVSNEKISTTTAFDAFGDSIAHSTV